MNTSRSEVSDMDVSHTLTLNEGALQQLPDDKKPHFVFEWLRFLDKVLVAAQKVSCNYKNVNIDIFFKN